MGLFSCLYALHNVNAYITSQRNSAVFKNPHLWVSLTAHFLHFVFFYSQDPVWSRPTFLFLRTYCVGLLSSMEWSITKVSVAKHSGTPVFKVSNLLTVWTNVWVKYFRCGTIPVSEGGLDFHCEITLTAYMCLHSWHSWHNCPSDLSVIAMYNRHQSCVFHLWGILVLCDSK